VRHVVRLGRMHPVPGGEGRFEGVILDLEVHEASKPGELTLDFGATTVRVPRRGPWISERIPLAVLVPVTQHVTGRLALSSEAPAALVFGLQNPLHDTADRPPADLLLLFSSP
jgi:hypothetical protein